MVVGDHHTVLKPYPDVALDVDTYDRSDRLLAHRIQGPYIPGSLENVIPRSSWRLFPPRRYGDS